MTSLDAKFHGRPLGGWGHYFAFGEVLRPTSTADQSLRSAEGSSGGEQAGGQPGGRRRAGGRLAVSGPAHRYSWNSSFAPSLLRSEWRPPPCRQATATHGAADDATTARNQSRWQPARNLRQHIQGRLTSRRQQWSYPMIIHLTVRARHLPITLTAHEVAEWLWPRLQQAFPKALSALLMPNHPHLMTTSDDISTSRRAFKNVIAGLRRSNNPGASILWDPIGPAAVLADVQKARRMVRYVALNPCRAGLVDDPLSWPWSTHRDVVGAIADPWVDAGELAHALEQPRAGFADELHQYVSSAPSVSVLGTPPPCQGPRTAIAQHPLNDLLEAAAAASRGKPADILRRSQTRALFLQLAMRHGWDETGRLAALCGISPRAIQQHRARPSSPALSSAELCLSDERLRRWEVGAQLRSTRSFASDLCKVGGITSRLAKLRGRPVMSCRSGRL